MQIVKHVMWRYIHFHNLLAHVHIPLGMLKQASSLFQQVCKETVTSLIMQTSNDCNAWLNVTKLSLNLDQKRNLKYEQM